MTTTGGPPVRTQTADELLRIVAYQAEQNLALAELVHDLAKTERDRKRAAERERKAAALYGAYACLPVPVQRSPPMGTVATTRREENR